MHAVGNQCNERLVNKGTVHKRMYPWEIRVKDTWQEQGRPFTEAMVGESFAFSYGSCASIEE